MGKEGKIEKESLEKEKEGKMEKEKQSYPIALIYRENDLYKEMIPQVVKTLESLGHEVKIQNFPAGTEWEKMKEQIDENKIITSEELESGMKIITDGTLSETVSDSKTLATFPPNVEDREARWIARREMKILKAGYLDKLFDKATATMFLGKDYVKSVEKIKNYEVSSDGQESFELCEKSFKAIIERILEDKENHPHKAYIMPISINGHLPFNKKIEEREAAELLQKWLKGSFDKTKVDAECIIDYDFSRQALEARDWDFRITEEINQEGNWVIGNRHGIFNAEWSEDGKGLLYDPERKAKVLQMPVPSMLESAINEGLISFSKEEKEKLNNILTTILKEDFGEEEKEEKEEE